MNEFLFEALKQAPILVIVLVFLYMNNKEWRLYLKERNGHFERALKEGLDQIADKLK